jgi:hypothetical protein
MTKPLITIHNTETDEITTREMTADEHASYVKDIETMEAKQAEAKTRATARASALAKLAALGLSADEIAAL